MKTIFSALILCLLLNGCKKEDATDSSNETNGEKTTLTLSTAKATPGDMLEIKLDKKVTETQVDIVVNMNTVKGYANGDSTYLFIVPIVASGNVTITVPSIKSTNSLSLTISKYDPIINPQTVINEFVAARNQSIDSITKVIPGRNYQTSPESVILLKQLKEEWAFQMEKLSESDKEMLAYVLQKNMPNQTSSLAPISLSNATKNATIQADLGDKLVTLAQACVKAQVNCKFKGQLLVGSCAVFLLAPNPFTAIVFLSIFTTFHLSIADVMNQERRLAEVPSIAEAISDIFIKSAMAVEFTNNSEKALSLSVEFRNLDPGDTSIQTDINSAFKNGETIVTIDEKIKNLYLKATALFSKLVGTYPSYTRIIGSLPKNKVTADIDGADIQIKGVSDNRISYTTSLSGKTRKIKITSTATTEFNFKLILAYTRKIDGKEFTKEIACIFKPQSYKLGFLDPNKGAVPSTEITYEKYTVDHFILLDGNGIVASEIDYRQISIANNSNSNVRIDQTYVSGVNGSFALQFKTSQTSRQVTSFDVLYQSKKLQTMNVAINDSTDYYKSLVPGDWIVYLEDVTADGTYVFNQQQHYTYFADGSGICTKILHNTGVVDERGYPGGWSITYEPDYYGPGRYILTLGILSKGRITPGLSYIYYVPPQPGWKVTTWKL